MLVRRRYLVSGHVQGVGFRYFTEQAARRENVGGFVRNRPDGVVEVEIEGDAEAVERVERAIRRGPAGARVEAVETDELAPTAHHTGFMVRR